MLNANSLLEVALHQQTTFVITLTTTEREVVEELPLRR